MFLPKSQSKGGGQHDTTKHCKQGAGWEWPHLLLCLFWDLACRGIFSLMQKDLFLEKTGERSFSWKRKEKDHSLGKDRRKIMFLEKTGPLSSSFSLLCSQPTANGSSYLSSGWQARSVFGDLPDPATHSPSNWTAQKWSFALSYGWFRSWFESLEAPIPQEHLWAAPRSGGTIYIFEWSIKYARVWPGPHRRRQGTKSIGGHSLLHTICGGWVASECLVWPVQHSDHNHYSWPAIPLGSQWSFNVQVPGSHSAKAWGHNPALSPSPSEIGSGSTSNKWVLSIQDWCSFKQTH